MPIQWDIFRGGQTIPSNNRLMVSINRKGVLTLNINKYTREILGRPEAVLVMFNKKDTVIGLSPTHTNDPDGFEVKAKNGGQNYTVHINPFCRHHNILVEATERFATPGLTPEGYLTLDLKNTINVSHRKRRRDVAVKRRML